MLKKSYLRRSTAAICLTFSLSLNAQNYSVISSATESHYWAAETGYIYSIKADSIIGVNPKIFYNFKVTVPVKDKCIYGESATVPSWLGEKVLLYQNGKNVFFNLNNDSIIFYTQKNIGDSWVMYTSNAGAYFTATITGKTISQVLGQTDSVKTIALQLKNSLNENLNHPFNNYTLVLSKNFGLIQTVQMKTFFDDLALLKQFDPTGNKELTPYFSSHFLSLYGTSSIPGTTPILTSADIFDFQVGDEFDTEVANLSGNSKGSLNYNYQVMKVIERQSDGANITYTFDMTTSGVSYYTVGAKNQKHTFSNKIVTTTYGPDDPKPYYTTAFTSFIQITGEGKSKIFRSRLYNCAIADVFYKEGFGGPYYNHSSGDFYNITNHRILKYYKKENSTWGTPVVLDPACNGSLAWINKYTQSDTVSLGESAYLEIDDFTYSTENNIYNYSLWVNDIKVANQTRNSFIIPPQILRPGINPVKVQMRGGGNCTLYLEPGKPWPYIGAKLNNIFVKTCEGGIKLYPNPSKGLITLDLNVLEDSSVDLTVYDLFGRKIIEKRRQATRQGMVQFDFTGKEGMYLLTSSCGGKIISTRFIILQP